MRQEKRLELIKTAISEYRKAYWDMKQKLPDEDGDGFHGAARKDAARNVKDYKLLKEFYSKVVNAMEFP